MLVEVSGGEVVVPGQEEPGVEEDLVVARGEASRVEAKMLGKEQGRGRGVARKVVAWLLDRVLDQEVKVVVLGQDKVVEEDRVEVKVGDRGRALRGGGDQGSQT